MSDREYEAYQLCLLGEAGAEYVRIHALPEPQAERECRESHGFLLSLDEAMALEAIPHDLGPERACGCTYRPARI